MNSAFEPDRDVMTEWGLQAVNFLVNRRASRRQRRAPATSGIEGRSYAVLPEDPTDMAQLLEMFGDVLDTAIDTTWANRTVAGTSSGLFASAVGEFVARGLNQHTGISARTPDLVSLEHGILSWLCRQVGLPTSAGGLITTGASLATLAALVAARYHRLGDQIQRGALYVNRYAHQNMTKAAYTAGLPPDCVRLVPSTSDLRMDVAAAEEMIIRDRAEGKIPFLIAATAGTADTGTIDPLVELGRLSARRGMWLHVDAADGGGFVLTDRGRRRLAGLALADSVSIDPHKSLFTCLGTGMLLVRDVALLQARDASTGPSSPTLSVGGDLSDFTPPTTEPTREPRGPRLWFALHAHGIRAFRTALDEKLDLAEMAHRWLAADPRLDTPWAPDLSTVVARVRGPSDEKTRRLIELVNRGSEVTLSASRIDGRLFFRMCLLFPATHRAQVTEVLKRIQMVARRI